MNKRICFAGFTEREAASISQAATENVGEWECAFAQDGPDTLAEISSGPFDAVVATLQMDGMRGDEVLQQAVNLQPDALRFIVGDTGDTSIIFSCVKDGNNFIARTSNADEILSAVQRGFELDTQVASEGFAQTAGERAAVVVTSKPDRDWLVRVLVPATAVAVLIAVVVWWNRRPADELVLRVKALATETPAPPAPAPKKTAPESKPEDSISGFAETKVK